MKKIIAILLYSLIILTANAQIKSKLKADAFIVVVLNDPKINTYEIVNEDPSANIDFDSDIIVEAWSNGLSKSTINGDEVFIISAKGTVTYYLGLLNKSMKDLTGLPNSKINISAIKEGFHYAGKIWYPTSSKNSIIICLQDKILGYNVKFDKIVVEQK